MAGLVEAWTWKVEWDVLKESHDLTACPSHRKKISNVASHFGVVGGISSRCLQIQVIFINCSHPDD